MPTISFKIAVVCCVSLAATAPAAAQPLFPHTDSIEATVANADSVYIATLNKFDDGEWIEGREVHNTTIAIEDTLKTDIFADEHFELRQVSMPRPASVLADWKERSCRLLVATDDYAPHATTLIDLTPGKVQVMTADFTLLRDPDAVIEAAKEALQTMPAAVKRIRTFKLAVRRELVADTEWEPYYGTGGFLMLSVPVDQRLEKWAHDNLHSESYRNRFESAKALRYFKSYENIERVKKLLDDPGVTTTQIPREDTVVEERIYAVREEAYRTLNYWGVDVAQPVIREYR